MKKSNLQIVLIIALIAFLSTVFLNAVYSQSIHAMAGYKSAEIGYTYLDEETELIFGFSISAVDSKVAESRANKNDRGKIHDFKDQFTPAMFFLVGGKFDGFSLIGKLGGSNVKQEINGIKDEKYVYFVAGIIFSLELSERVSLLSSYDSVNSGMIGVNFKF